MRKALLIGVAALCLAGWGLAHADDMSDMPGMSGATAQEGQKVTLVGEVLDMDCYMNEGLHGGAHRSCAVACLNDGSPVGLLTDDGKAYFLSADKDKTKYYDLLRKMGGQRCRISGTLLRRGGALCLNVERAKKL